MKISLLMSSVLGFLLLLSGVVHDGHSQDFTASLQYQKQAYAPIQKENLKSLQSVLEGLQLEYEVYLNYEAEVVKDKMVDIRNLNESTDSDIEKSLVKILKPLKLEYEKLKDNYYVIFPEGAKHGIKPIKGESIRIFDNETVPSNRGRLATISNERIIRQMVEKSISGTVTDLDNGEPLPGANVVVKGTTIGTVTDIDGNYRLSVPDDATTLVFSSVGYTSEEVTIGSQSVINISMSPDIKSLSEVVVVGYGTVNKSDLTGSVASLDQEKLNQGVNASVDQMLQGRAPGVQVTQASSEPGGGVSIRIRGAGSITAGNEPLYVIDGLPIDNSAPISGTGANFPSSRTPRNPLNSLNPSDIASIEILKDASATAIYGSRGANGVVLITTKSGQEGKLKIEYDGYFGQQQVANRLDVLNADEYIAVLNGIRSDLGEAPEFSQEEISAIGSGVNWQNQIFRVAPVQNHNLSFSGGSANTQYLVSLNYFDQKGVVVSSGIKKYIGRVNLKHSIEDKFNFGINLNTSLVNDDFVSYGISSNEFAGVINSAINMDPTMDIYDADGNYQRSPFISLDNPLALAYGIDAVAETNRTFGNFYAEYFILNNLSAKLNVGSDRQQARRDVYNSTATIAGEGASGIATVLTSQRSNYLGEFTLNYNKTLDEKHNFNVLAGTTYQKFINSNLDVNLRGFPADVTQTDNLGIGDGEQDNVGSNKNDNSLLSYLGRVNYAFDNRYLLTASIRADGSSRFGANNKFGYFPSFALGWKLSEEDFIPQTDFLEELKFRASWGKTGNQSIGNYASLATFSATGNAVLNDVPVSAVAPARIPNPDLKWETTTQLNIGLDATLFRGRIYSSLDYFIKNTEDMLLNLPVPSTTGFATFLDNVGKMRNSGIEFMIESKNLVGALEWSTNLNLTAIQNEVTDLGPIPEIITGGVSFTNQISIIQEGLPLNSYYGYQVLGIFQQGDDIESSAQPDAQPGYIKFRDVNGDNQINADDRVVLGDPFPDLNIGLNNTFSYKGFDLSIFFQGIFGAEILNNNLIESLYPINFRRNKLAEPYLERWTPENPTNQWPSHVEPNAYGGSAVNSLTIEDATFIRLRNVNLSYQLPISSEGFINTARIYLTAQNLFTITNYRGYDPDVNSFGDSNIKIDYNAYPVARTFLLGVNIGF